MQWMVLFMKYKSSIYCSCVLIHYMWTQLLGLFVYLMIIVFSFQARKNNNPGLLRQLAKYLFFFSLPDTVDSIPAYLPFH